MHLSRILLGNERKWFLNSDMRGNNKKFSIKTYEDIICSEKKTMHTIWLNLIMMPLTIEYQHIITTRTIKIRSSNIMCIYFHKWYHQKHFKKTYTRDNMNFIFALIIFCIGPLFLFIIRVHFWVFFKIF
jgi:hypothetical protein